jgi:hypothetical protein
MCKQVNSITGSGGKIVDNLNRKFNSPLVARVAIAMQKVVETTD